MALSPARSLVSQKISLRADLLRNANACWLCARLRSRPVAGSAAPGVDRRRVREGFFGEKASGAQVDRPELKRVLNDVLRDGDTLVVWKFDRLARPLRA
jgi:hypothetical protein